MYIFCNLAWGYNKRINEQNDIERERKWVEYTRRNLMSMEEHETRNEVQKNIVIDGGDMMIDIRTGEGFRPWSWSYPLERKILSQFYSRYRS